MPPYETRSSQFGLISGIRQPHSDMALVAEPAGLFAPEARKGQLYIVAETDQDVARGRDACQAAIKAIRKHFYDDSSYSVTSALRKALSAANKALYEHNFGVMAQKRAVVGVTCAVIKGNDLYIAQVAPADHGHRQRVRRDHQQPENVQHAERRHADRVPDDPAAPGGGLGRKHPDEQVAGDRGGRDDELV